MEENNGMLPDMNLPNPASPLPMPLPPAPAEHNCPRCLSHDTKFCYYNNYSLTQPRHFCKSCRRYWTQGGSLRNIPIGGSSRKAKNSSASAPVPAAPPAVESVQIVAQPQIHHQFGFTTSNGSYPFLGQSQLFNMESMLINQQQLSIGVSRPFQGLLFENPNFWTSENRGSTNVGSSSSTPTANPWPNLSGYGAGSFFTKEEKP